MYQNTLTLVGTMATDVVAASTDEGVRLARFRLMLTRRHRDRVSKSYVNADPTFVSVVCWRRLAENVLASLRRGDPVIVTGRLNVRIIDRDNRPRTVVEIDASAVGPDLNRVEASPARSEQGTAA
ncbi:MAG: single-stranded DNA-binding protein [Candidatus Nanopelagicales bacterium]